MATPAAPVASVLSEFLLSHDSGEAARRLRAARVGGAELVRRAVQLALGRSAAAAEDLAALVVVCVLHGVVRRADVEARMADLRRPL